MLTLVVSVACTSSLSDSPLHIARTSGAHPIEPTRFAPPTFRGVATEHRSLAADLVAHAVAFMATEGFQHRLSSVPCLANLPGGGCFSDGNREMSSGDEVLRLLLGVDVRSPDYRTTWTDACHDFFSRETAHTDFVGAGAYTCLHEVVLDRWASCRLEAQACAINTIVHEWTHAVPATDGAGVRFQDSGHGAANFPLVSYTVGSIAQCAYLERDDRLSDDDFRTCVLTVGTTSFNPRTCADGWWTTFRRTHQSASSHDS